MALGILAKLRTHFDDCPPKSGEKSFTRPLMGEAADFIERLCGYVEHETDCEDNEAYPGCCSCGLSRLIGELRGDD